MARGTEGDGISRPFEMAGSELHDLLVQLARFCRVNDTTASHVLECKAELSEIDLSALDRLFSLFFCHRKRVGLLSIDLHAFTLRRPLAHDADDADSGEH